MLQISDFFTEVKDAKSSDIAIISFFLFLPIRLNPRRGHQTGKYASEHHNVNIYANRSEKMRPFTV